MPGIIKQNLKQFIFKNITILWKSANRGNSLTMVVIDGFSAAIHSWRLGRVLSIICLMLSFSWAVVGSWKTQTPFFCFPKEVYEKSLNKMTFFVLVLFLIVIFNGPKILIHTVSEIRNFVFSCGLCSFWKTIYKNKTVLPSILKRISSHRTPGHSVHF